MTVKEILMAYLKKNEFDGLVHAGTECGCDLEDFMPCDEICGSCEPGYKHKCPEGHEADWIISISKENPDFNEE